MYLISRRQCSSFYTNVWKLCPGKRPCGPKSRCMFKRPWALAWDTTEEYYILAIVIYCITSYYWGKNAYARSERGERAHSWEINNFLCKFYSVNSVPVLSLYTLKILGLETHFDRFNTIFFILSLHGNCYPQSPVASGWRLRLPLMKNAHTGVAVLF